MAKFKIPYLEPLVENGKSIGFEDLKIALTAEVELSVEAKQSIIQCREYLDAAMQKKETPTYGINTGFGDLCNIEIPETELEELQNNLVRSHACGMGDEIPEEIVRIMLLLKAISLSQGHSGVQLETVELLIELYNRKLTPKIYKFGSLGASGDLAPLAHMAMCLIGEGEFLINGETLPASEVLAKHNLKPLKLKSKEGLALLNGTQFIQAFGVKLLLESEQLLIAADVIAAVSLEGFDGRIDAFDSKIHKIRNQKGQQVVAERVRHILKGSELTAKEKKQVQDPYAFRCVPQVHGASVNAFEHVKQLLEDEWNGVTDNPNIFPDADEILSGGNFHAQQLALPIDYLKIALHELANISERRTFKLIGGNQGLPAFLSKNSGKNSGLMIPQYTAASIVSYNKQLCTPASIDSIVSSNGQEDHVSMGANAATQCYEICQNVQKVLGIELFNASQAMSYRQENLTSPLILELLKAFRSKVDIVENDKFLHPELIHAENFVRHYDWMQLINNY